MSSKTIKRALTTPALLSQILLYIHPDDLKPCTTVSKAWSIVALDYMWEVVSSLQPVLRLLAPLETDRKQRKAILRFSKPIERKAWERFKSYARRIRVLCFDDGKDYDLCQVALTLTSSLSNANISQPIFPNLRKLSCVGSSLSLTKLFISPNLSNLAMTTNVSHDDLSFFTSVLPVSVPHLQTLSISCYWCSKSEGAKDADIMAMLEKMPTVVDVEVPSGWLSRLPPSAVDLLAERPKLRRLAASLELDDSGPGPCLGLASAFCPHLEKDRFSSLRELEIVSPIHLAMSALSTKAKARIPLTKLCISDPDGFYQLPWIKAPQH
ncbi:hypothetical protein ONZ45_g19116 [Pleurotus djamor]|nr:hypothetical protein ONZ45_g19116 [Pleurotus djamor]